MNPQGATILAVDDNPESLAFMVSILSAKGYVVRPADSGELALTALSAATVDLIVLDMRMTGIDGFEVCRRLQAQSKTKDIPVILISGFTDQSEWTTGLQLGASDYLTKPFQAEELLTRVGTHLKLSRTHLDLVRTLEALKEQELQYRNLADSGRALIWTAGLEKRREYFNKPWLEFRGRTLDEEKGWGWLDGLHPEDSGRVLEAYHQAFDKRQSFEIEYRLRNASGEYRWVHGVGTPSWDSHHQFVGYVGHCLDVTENLKIQETLRRNDKLDSLGILAGGIAHDFNNLLSGLFAYLSLAKDQCLADSAAARYLERAMGAFDRAKDLTYQLLTFSKGGTPVSRTRALDPIVRKNVLFALSGSQVISEFLLPQDLPACDFDENQIGQVIDNLAINARQAMPAGGKLTVTGKTIRIERFDLSHLKEGDYVRLSFTDTGSGILPEVRHQIFDPFFTTKPSGSGLGLATCYSIMHKHEGAIEVESEPGEGSTFHLYFPVSLKTISAPQAQAVSDYAGSGTILLIDDEEVIRETCREWLNALGHKVLTARDIAETMERLAEAARRIPPLVCALVDLTLPGGPGAREILIKIREAFPDLPVVAVSGYNDDPVIAKPSSFGFTDSLRKPFHKAELASILGKILAKTV